MLTHSTRLRKTLQALVDLLIVAPITIIPGPIGNRLRYQFYKRRLKYLGRGTILDQGISIQRPQYVSIGDNTHIDKYVLLTAGPTREGRVVSYKENRYYQGGKNELHIGANCHIAPFTLISGHGGVWIGNNSGVASGCAIYSLSHHYRELSAGESGGKEFRFSTRVPSQQQALISGEVVMQDNTGLGVKSVILPGVTIGEGSWVGGMSLVLLDIPEKVIASGNPARVVKQMS